jgi:crotonobetainyl-CoA:carnitine CoA-transferase CaiB-like acyl-CoA transferase
MHGLEGVKVLELGTMVSAAYATKLMADLGADVIKVEEPGGDLARRRGPFPGGVVDPEKSGLFLHLNTNKRGMTLDLRRQQEELHRLVRWADILVHNWEIVRSLQTVGVAAFPSMSSKDLVEDAHLNERGFFVRLPHPEVGTQTHAAIPWILTDAANGVRSPAPLLGQHTDEVLRDVLRYADEDIARLREQRVLY